MAFEKLLDEYAARRARALAGGGADKYARRKKAGVLNARERIAALVDEGSFIESGLFGASGVYPEQEAETQTDGKLAGFARIDGRNVAVVVNDFTVKGASTSATNGKKVGHMKRTATARHAARDRRRIDGRAFARRDGRARHGASARQRQHSIPAHARDAARDCRSRPLVRLVRVARVPRRFRSDAKRRDHGGIEPAPDRD